jgi:DNA-binding CsgD family transcriptional regulator
MTPREREAVGRLADALTHLDDIPAAHIAVAEALCRLAGAEGGILLLGRKFTDPAAGAPPDAQYAPDAQYGPVPPKAALVEQLIPTFAPQNPALPLLSRIPRPAFSVPELVGTRVWEQSPYYREFLGAVVDTHAVLGIALRSRDGAMVGGLWLGHPDRRRFNRSVRLTIDRVAGPAAQALVNLDRWRRALRSAPPEAGEPVGIDLDAARAAGLTDREAELLDLLARGLGHKQAAAALGVSYHTVTTHARSLFAKLRVNGRVEAINAVRKLAARNPVRARATAD